MNTYVSTNRCKIVIKILNFIFLKRIVYLTILFQKPSISLTRWKAYRMGQLYDKQGTRHTT